MNGDAIRNIVVLEAAKKNWFQVSSEPEDVYFLVDFDGDASRHVAEHPYPELTVYGTEALLEAAKTEAERGSVVELYYSTDCIVALAMESSAEGRTAVTPCRYLCTRFFSS